MRTRCIFLAGIVGLAALPEVLAAQASTMQNHSSTQAVALLVSHRTDLGLSDAQVAWLRRHAVRAQSPVQRLLVVGYDQQFGKNGRPRFATVVAAPGVIPPPAGGSEVVRLGGVPGKAGVRRAILVSPAPADRLIWTYTMVRGFGRVPGKAVPVVRRVALRLQDTPCPLSALSETQMARAHALLDTTR